MTATLTSEFREAYGDDAARSVFELGEEPAEPLASISAFGSGAALRAAPIGLFYHRSPQRAAEVAAQAAWITHAHPLGADGAALQAAAVAELTGARELAPRAMVERLRSRVRTRWFREQLGRWGALSGSVATTARVMGRGTEAHRSVPTALYCFLQNCDSFVNSVLFSLSLGGHASALASMTGALAGAHLGQSGIPKPWIDRLENRRELTELADQLLDVARPSS